MCARALECAAQYCSQKQSCRRSSRPTGPRSRPKAGTIAVVQQRGPQTRGLDRQITGFATEFHMQQRRLAGPSGSCPCLNTRTRSPARRGMSFAAAVEGAADPELGSTPAFAEPVLRAWERNCSNARYGQLPQTRDRAQRLHVRSWRSATGQYRPQSMPPQEQVS